MSQICLKCRSGGGIPADPSLKARASSRQRVPARAMQVLHGLLIIGRLPPFELRPSRDIWGCGACVSTQNVPCQSHDSGALGNRAILRALACRVARRRIRPCRRSGRAPVSRGRAPGTLPGSAAEMRRSAGPPPQQRPCCSASAPNLKAMPCRAGYAFVHRRLLLDVARDVVERRLVFAEEMT
jgi:hypothetical protein